MTPTRISINATEMPVRMEIKLPMSARPIQTEAINQILFSIKTPSAWRSHQLARFSPAIAGEGKLHCLRRNSTRPWHVRKRSYGRGWQPLLSAARTRRTPKDKLRRNRNADGSAGQVAAGRIAGAGVDGK